ncbi:efflux RND transporter periplasmic adaptor subunit [bacterium NHP-B]|nr:efflux RND transporter periplasmic adaptor subunit [bacterium NHP-B]
MVSWRKIQSFIDTNKPLSIAVVALFLLGVVGLLFLLWPRGTGGGSKVRPFLVETAVAKRGPITRVYNTNGILAAVKTVQLYPELDGRIQKIHIKQGLPVKEGQLLVQLDDRLMCAQLQEAEAKLSLAESEYERTRNLWKQKFVAKAVLDEKKSRLNVAKAEVKIAKVRVDQAKVVAPFDGMIGLTKVSEGAMVNRNQELGIISMLDPLYVDFSVPESFLKDISVGSLVYVTVEGSNDLPMEAVIDAIDSRAQPGTHSIQMRALLENSGNENSGNLMRPGQFARVAVDLGKDDNAVLVPMKAIEQSGTRFFVYIVLDNTAIQKEVVLGTREGDVVQIKEGLQGGEPVVTVGQVNIHDGAFVKTDAGPTPDESS